MFVSWAEVTGAAVSSSPGRHRRGAGGHRTTRAGAGEVVPQRHHHGVGDGQRNPPAGPCPAPRRTRTVTRDQPGAAPPSRRTSFRGRVTAPDGAARLRCLPRREQSDDRDVVERRGEGVPPHRRPRRELRARQAWYGACSSAAASPEQGGRGRELSYGGPIRGQPSGHEPHHGPSLGATTEACTRMTHPLPTIRAVTGVWGDGIRHRDRCRRQSMSS